ncbi:MAG: hypothetical protein AAGH65_07970 [Pseudomonadota bacterium]
MSELMLDGQELHPALTTVLMSAETIRHVPLEQINTNPQRPEEPDVIDVIARSGSQGRMSSEGVSSALYALYTTGDRQIGLYGLEAATGPDADRIERELRSIWSHNVSLNRTQIHRHRQSLIVVWTDGDLPLVLWQGVNQAVSDRLSAGVPYG